ncbi:hypothetical protein HTY54_07645 [Escherichia coli]|nr:hypothetical protein [Escherichia coli]MBW6054766.1 hypothetical protein [Escherichia coli]MBW6086314.1 hypothetical protein [Escherichia coli]MBW6090243.1 hypothetical protein [Escherichia coli]MBW6100927.1 hypothetical protein [Escherichia coli]
MQCVFIFYSQAVDESGVTR